MKTKNCNLELSQREFDEVLAVLRARTPSSRRRLPLRMMKKRYERLNEPKKVSPNEHTGCERNSSHEHLKQDGKKSPKNEETKTEGLYGVANKADVLLNAILRTSSTNGEAKSPQESAEDERSLPSVLNKKLHRLRQLFKREQECSIFNNAYNVSSKSKQRVEYVKSPESSPGTSRHDSNSHSTNFEEPGIVREPTSSTSHEDGGREDSDEEDDSSDKTVPSVIEQERFRRSLENAASMVFHSRTGLPLTSSPAPLRRGSCCFDFDSSLNSVSSKRR